MDTRKEQEVKAGTEERFLTCTELSKVLGVTEPTVYLWAKQRKIPHYRIGAEARPIVRFRLSEVNEWLQAGKK
jgi:excisionase family DNA binding protein